VYENTPRSFQKLEVHTENAVYSFAAETNVSLEIWSRRNERKVFGDRFCLENFVPLFCLVLKFGQ
jgi:hypothetical protein